MLLRLEGRGLFNSAAIVARADRKEAVGLAKDLSDYLNSKRMPVFLEQTLAKRLGSPEAALTLEKMRADLVITIGGDGTILRTCLQLPKPEPPILAINMGVRGFLAEVPPKEGITAVEKCLKGEFILERCMKIGASIGKKRLPAALNEVFVTSHAPAKLLYAKMWKDKTAVAESRADGFVVASQVGSTGYSLSGGGPVLDPEVDAFVLTPVTPLTMFHPIVFSSRSTLTIELIKPKRAVVVLDGHYTTEIKQTCPRIEVAKSEHESSFVRFGQNFYKRLKGRLLFSRGESL